MILQQKLSLEQKQSLSMTTELVQSIKILQLTSKELEAYIDSQILDNPVIECEMHIYEDSSGYSRKAGNSTAEPYTGADLFEETLSEHLLFQLQFVKAPKGVLEAAKYIIASLDDNGYLTQTIDELAAVHSKRNDVVKALDIVRGFDPAGVCAYDLSDCLCLQLKVLGVLTKTKETVIKSYLEHIASGKFEHISREVGIPVDEVKGILHEIRQLDPKPGKAFASSSETTYITPDVYLEIENGKFNILMSESRLPKICINEEYVLLSKQKEQDKEFRTYLKGHIADARALIGAIEQRNSTIYKVAVAIMDYQRVFFFNGGKALRPLLQKDIADALHIHESTVSRAVNGKYIQTPSGLFELKYFFSGSMGRMSSHAVKERIKKIIDKEKFDKPLSDKKIADILTSEGVEISRRTVAKYRDELGISPSHRRNK